MRWPVCAAGYGNMTAGDCTACGKGKYSAKGDDTCTFCIDNTTTTTTTATVVAECSGESQRHHGDRSHEERCGVSIACAVM